MILVKPTTEADMIAVYLRSEIDSKRFGKYILNLLEKNKQNRAIIDHPDITSAEENEYRRNILIGYRAYVFDEIPTHTEWFRAILSRGEVADIRYIDYDYWNELSNHTRLPCNAIEGIFAGRTIYDVDNSGFLQVAQAMREGAHFPELILVSPAPGSALTVYEGHVRLTAYLLAPECIPQELGVIVGFAPECERI